MLLAGGLEHDFYDFSYIYIENVIIPTDELILFRGVETRIIFAVMAIYQL